MVAQVVHHIPKIVLRQSKKGKVKIYVNKKKMKEHGEVGEKRKESNLKTFLPWNA